VLMQDALNDIAGTGSPRHRHFLRQVDQFHAQWRAFFVPLIFRRARMESYDAVPRFTYHEETTPEVAGRVLVSVLGLAVPAAGLGWLGLRRSHRYPVVG
jgi:ABC-2 type transport system permease protein